jgi:hypothetical protein
MRWVLPKAMLPMGVGLTGSRRPLSDFRQGRLAVSALSSLSTISSTSVFHSPQEGQRPSHLTLEAPQDWQKKDFLILDMGGSGFWDETNRDKTHFSTKTF